jgi:hypothetical protein
MRRATVFRFLVLASAILPILAAPSVAAYEFVSDSCTWDHEDPSIIDRQFVLSSNRDECMDGAANRIELIHPAGTRLIWLGDTDVDSLYAIPTEPCNCGDYSMKAGWAAGMCQVTQLFSCSKPGTGCEWWIPRLQWESDAVTTTECREKAAQLGQPYYGYEGMEAASQPPQCECVCGETRAQWFFDSQCGSMTFRCLKRLKVEWKGVQHRGTR